MCMPCGEALSFEAAPKPGCMRRTIRVTSLFAISATTGWGHLLRMRSATISQPVWNGLKADVACNTNPPIG